MLDQLKIDLMNLSRPKLLGIAKEKKIDIAGTMNKEVIGKAHSIVHTQKLNTSCTAKCILGS